MFETMPSAAALHGVLNSMKRAGGIKKTQFELTKLLYLKPHSI
jgi:hypothetical protein